MKYLTRLAMDHYGKLIVLGSGIIVLPAIFEIRTGIPVSPEGWIGAISLAGAAVAAIGIKGWHDAISEVD